jgi:hypothetical protein
VNTAEQVALLRKAAQIVTNTAGPLGFDVEDAIMHGRLVAAASALEDGDPPYNIETLLHAAQHIIDAQGGKQ